MEFQGLLYAGLDTGADGPALAAPSRASISLQGGIWRLTDTSTGAAVMECSQALMLAWRAGERLVMLRQCAADPGAAAQKQQQQDGRKEQTFAVTCTDAAQADAVCNACSQPLQQQQAQQALKAGVANGVTSVSQPSSNPFDAKIDKSSSTLYFHYYGMLQHQQNMLQDQTRTGTYYAAILENRSDFAGRTVMDVGAGSGILSLFAAQAGARKVYAVEASGMAKFAKQLAAANPGFGHVVEVVHAKVEAVSLPERVDVLVSEPMGTLLVNERMLETYIYARDRFLKQGGRMFPQIGRIHAAAFSDVVLYSELYNKAAFWQQNQFCGVDLGSLYAPAMEGYFAQVVVDAFEPDLLVSDCATRVLDFGTVTEAELADITIPLNLTVALPCAVHGLACWFDVLFNGSTTQRWLSTAPGLPTTHWFQLRCVLQQPILVTAPNTRLQGQLRMVAHERQSYDVFVTLAAPPLQPGQPGQQSTGKFDLKEPYYRQVTTWYTQQGQQHAQQQQQQTGGSYYYATQPAPAASAQWGL